MYRNGHYGVALLTFTPVGVALVMTGLVDLAFVVGAGALWLAMLPDLDHRVPGLSHRGVTHTVWFALLLGGVLGAAGVAVGRLGLGAPYGPETLGAVGAAVGLVSVGSHLLADVLTPMGIRPLWPLSGRKFTLSLWTADSTLGNYSLLSLGVFVTAAWVGVLFVG
ncbi:metal-dependent hydrolase [Salinigranum halophilum]|uniref:metal-dependent hydrolase n=1 Tax=Salinigranum halophilum TaxID=2565931 RepID=UPI0010A8C5F4|nr:metal-dependent hydrolase [Salinigranum halophilum]